jgi:hypothetical protein
LESIQTGDGSEWPTAKLALIVPFLGAYWGYGDVRLDGDDHVSSGEVPAFRTRISTNSKLTHWKEAMHKVNSQSAESPDFPNSRI